MRAWAWITGNWERCFLFLIALVFLAFSIRFFLKIEVTAATAAFGMFFLCLIYSNLARFKHFKGFGIEAELWEDKQKEAAVLIDRLKNVVGIYTREAIIGQVMRGRIGSNTGWKHHWQLYDRLVGTHRDIWTGEDFADLKRLLDGFFVFDVIGKLSQSYSALLSKKKIEARKAVNEKFKDAQADPSTLALIRRIENIQESIPDSYKVSENGNLAKQWLDMVEAARLTLEETAGVSLDFDAERLSLAKLLATQMENGGLKIDEKLLDLAGKDIKLGG